MNKIWLLTIEHRHGTDHWVCATEAVALSYLDNYVQQWWEDESEDEDEDEEIPSGPSQRRERYFAEIAQSESYCIEELPLLVV